MSGFHPTYLKTVKVGDSALIHASMACRETGIFCKGALQEVGVIGLFTFSLRLVLLGLG